MITRIDDLPAHVIGFLAVGEITADDYRAALDPTIEASSADGQSLRALFVLGEEFSGFKGGALLEDAKLGLKTWSAWERIAVVTDDKSIIQTMHLFGWMVPGQLKTFPLARQSEAVAWLSED